MTTIIFYIILIGLKLTGVITWSWWLVLILPIIIGIIGLFLPSENSYGSRK